MAIDKRPIDSVPAFVPMRRAQAAGLCPMCGKRPDGFKDEVSRREHAITGMCQACQDAFFDAEGEDND